MGSRAVRLLLTVRDPRRPEIQIFGKGTELGTQPLLPPGTCWICDQSPIQEEYRVIDTHRNARPGGPTVHESVRKYICEPCAVEMGKAMGLVDRAEFEKVVDELRDASLERDRLETKLEVAEAAQVRVVQVDELSDGFIAAAQDAVVEVVRAELAAQVKRVPAED